VDGISTPGSAQHCSYAKPGHCRMGDAEATVARVASGDHLLLALALASLIGPPFLVLSRAWRDTCRNSVFPRARACRSRLLLRKIPFSSLPVLRGSGARLGIVDVW